jgi:hypothetical protein
MVAAPPSRHAGRVPPNQDGGTYTITIVMETHSFAEPGLPVCGGKMSAGGPPSRRSVLPLRKMNEAADQPALTEAFDAPRCGALMAIGLRQRRKSPQLAPIYRHSHSNTWHHRRSASGPATTSTSTSTSTCHLWCAALSLVLSPAVDRIQIFQVVSAVPDHRAGEGDCVPVVVRVEGAER